MNLSTAELQKIACKTLGNWSEQDVDRIHPSYLVSLKAFLHRYPGQHDFTLLHHGSGDILCHSCGVLISRNGEVGDDVNGLDFFALLHHCWEDHIYSRMHREANPGAPPLSPRRPIQLLCSAEQARGSCNTALGRPINDDRALNPELQCCVRGILSRFPGKEFTFDAETGAIRCECGKMGNTAAIMPGVYDTTQCFLNYEMHLSTTQHQPPGFMPSNQVNNDIIDIDDDDEIVFMTPLRPSSAEKRKRGNTLPLSGSWTDTSLDVIEISSDEDDLRPAIRRKYMSLGLISPIQPLLPQPGPSQLSLHQPRPAILPPSLAQSQPSFVQAFDPWDDGVGAPQMPGPWPPQLTGIAPSWTNMQIQPLQPPGQLRVSTPPGVLVGPPAPIIYNPIPAVADWDRDHIPSNFGQGAQSFNLNYDNDGPVERIDIGGPDQGQLLKKFIEDAGKSFEGDVAVNDAVKQLGLSGLESRLPGLEVQLMPHQVIGVSWMLEQERDPTKKGGILADDMGLGKTVQMIATMAVHRPGAKTYREAHFPHLTDFGERKATLIVAPSALLQQWKTELDTKTVEGSFRVAIHHGKTKLKKLEDVADYDVVITTYHTLNQDFPRKKKKKNAKDFAPPGQALINLADEEDESEDEKEKWKLLAKVKWQRVVLDEAQFARNRLTISSQNVAKLDASHRWALTGTPVTNTLADLYSLLRFCHLRPFNDWKTFNNQIAKLQKKNPRRAGEKAQAVLKNHLLRRNKKSQIDGKPILQLGPKTIELVTLDFSEEEQKIYEDVETKAKLKVSKFVKAGTVRKNYQMILVLILRLRQACSHPSLLVEKPDGLVAEPDELEAERERARQLMGEDWVIALQKKLLEQRNEREVNDLSGEECPICMDVEAFSGDGRISSCMHKFCGTCLDDLFKTNAPNQHGADEFDGPNGDGDFERGLRPCPVCRRMMHPDKTFTSAAFEPEEEENDDDDEPSESTKGQERVAQAMPIPGKPAAGFKSEDPIVVDDDDDENLPDIGTIVPKRQEGGLAPKHEYASNLDVKSTPTKDGNPKKGMKGKGKAIAKALDAVDWGNFGGDELVEPSTKMTRMLELLENWNREAPNDKAILYSQWTSVLTMVQRLLRDRQIEALRYDGGMSRIHRDETIVKFKKPNGPKVMLISLKCGGVGLNLVEANRVINLDLAWNFATESQAYDRVHRIGQTKAVVVQRLVIKNTIEERIVNLQNQKQGLSDAALGEGKVGKMPRMTVRQLAALFDLHI